MVNKGDFMYSTGIHVFAKYIFYNLEYFVNLEHLLKI
jgi:hypothetical protein